MWLIVKGYEMSNKIYCKRCGHICNKFIDGSIARFSCPECGFIYYQNPFPCISTLVVDELNRVLLGLRAKESIYSNKWCLPCGFIEYEETYIKAAIRETQEETGILIQPQGIINVVSNKLDNGINSIVIVILAKPVTTSITPGDDIDEASWFDINSNLPELAFDADLYIINKYKKSLENKDEFIYLDLKGDSF